MPTLIELRLKASWEVRPQTRQVHGLACALFEGNQGAHLGQAKPFAVHPLSQEGASGEWLWRAAWLPDTPPPATVTATETLRVGHVSCTVAELLQRRVTHAGLAAGPPRAAVTVSFGSPTYFSQNGSGILHPDPRLIVGSWRRRWNSSLPGPGPLEIGETAWRETLPFLRLAAFDLRTETRESGHGRDQAGFTGTATLRLDRDAPPAARAVLGTLSRFAPYAGTGAQTTHGFGATVLVVTQDG
jgi:CRISPR-associated endoribonuclease Cas6